MLENQPIDTQIIQLIILAIVFVISIWFHEYAHAYVSSIFWDPTPKLQWRLTPNPIKHIDPIWFLMIFLIHFGWWRPVQIDPSYYKKPLRDELLVSLAWPFSNFLMAFIWSFLFVFAEKFSQTNFLINNFFQFFIFINIALWVFNLIPIYPLDGYRIIKFLKPSWAFFMEQNAIIFMIILLLLIFMPWNVIWTIIMNIVDPIYSALIFIAGSILWFK